MHEVSLAESIASSLIDLKKEQGWGRVVEVRLRIGALRQVFPEILCFAFETVTKGTELEGAGLAIDDIPISFRCRDCGACWGEDDPLCPECGSMHRETVAGNEMEIESVEVEEQT